MRRGLPHRNGPKAEGAGQRGDHVFLSCATGCGIGGESTYIAAHPRISPAHTT